ncbi:MAG: crossover junction endodeoxyribonuclease RuvC [Patescibacteria group bacterium]
MSTRSTPTRPNRVLAFDPGYERLGVAVVERVGSKETLIYSDCIRTSKETSFEDRLLALGIAAEELIKQFSPRGVALEEIYFQKNEKTATKIAEVRGLLTYIARKADIPVFNYTPQEVKIAVTGYGKSDKAAVTMMVQKLVIIPAKPRLDDEMDAIAIGLTCLASSSAHMA